ncbi:MAG: RidA family protein [Proteobacteria bacterium]|nr:RidA family protein [Pseudomonadota bacterium]
MERINISSGNPFEPVFGYCRAVRLGNQIHVAGTTAPAPYDRENAYEQAKAALKIIRNALIEAKADMKDVVRTVVYVTDMANLDEVAKAHNEAFADIRPASTVVAVVALAGPDDLVEIEAYAIVNEDKA